MRSARREKRCLACLGDVFEQGELTILEDAIRAARRYDDQSAEGKAGQIPDQVEHVDWCATRPPAQSHSTVERVGRHDRRSREQFSGAGEPLGLLERSRSEN